MKILSRITDRPLRCSINTPMSDRPSDAYRATPESIARAKQFQAEQRASFDAELRELLARSAKTRLRELISDHGALLIRTLLDELEAE